MLIANKVWPVNRLLAALPPSLVQQLVQRCDLVDLEPGEQLCVRGKPLRHVYFPLSGFISLAATVSGRPPLEMSLIGAEGMLGVMLVLGVGRMPIHALVQGRGVALRMSAAGFRQALRGNATLLHLLNRYLYFFVVQLLQTATCSRFHEVQPRLARWLLMTHDRAQADHFHLTHQALADMLGVQRSAVTIAAGALQDRGLIHYSRGEITVLARDALQASSCECYACVVEEYRRLFVTQ